MLSTNVDTTTELMSIALQAEREAIRRYKELSTLMQDANNASASALFDRMVIEEKGHERLLLKWMAREGIEEDNNIKPVKWTDPQVATDYNEEACSAYHCTPYRALAFAVHNEEIAFRFYTHVAANSSNAIVREHAEILAREELGHAALLRAERRKAYHEELNSHAQEPRLDASAIHSEVDLLTAAIHIDYYLLEQMKIIKKSTPQIETLLSASHNAICKHETTLRNKAENEMLTPGEEITETLNKLKSHNSYMQQKFNQPNQEVSRLWACCDRSFAFYDMIVETTDNENIMLSAQQLTSVALDRIGFLKNLFGDEPG